MLLVICYIGERYHWLYAILVNVVIGYMLYWCMLLVICYIGECYQLGFSIPLPWYVRVFCHYHRVPELINLKRINGLDPGLVYFGLWSLGVLL